MLTCSLNRNWGGIPAWTRSMSRGEQEQSGRVGRTQPILRQIRQQLLSTGNTWRPSEYIITHAPSSFQRRVVR